MYLNTETFCGLKVGFRNTCLPVLQDLRKRGSIDEFVHLCFQEIGHPSIRWSCLRTHSIEPLLGSQTIIVNPLHIFTGTHLDMGTMSSSTVYISYIFESPLPRCYASKNDASSLNLFLSRSYLLCGVRRNHPGAACCESHSRCVHHSMIQLGVLEGPSMPFQPFITLEFPGIVQHQAQGISRP